MAEARAIDRLSTAAARGDLREIETILQSNVNVNERNKFGRTPLQVRLNNLSSAFTSMWMLTITGHLTRAGCLAFEVYKRQFSCHYKKNALFTMHIASAQICFVACVSINDSGTFTFVVEHHVSTCCRWFISQCIRKFDFLMTRPLPWRIKYFTLYYIIWKVTVFSHGQIWHFTFSISLTLVSLNVCELEK